MSWDFQFDFTSKDYSAFSLIIINNRLNWGWEKEKEKSVGSLDFLDQIPHTWIFVDLGNAADPSLGVVQARTLNDNIDKCQRGAWRWFAITTGSQDGPDVVTLCPKFLAAMQDRFTQNERDFTVDAANWTLLTTLTRGDIMHLPPIDKLRYPDVTLLHEVRSRERGPTDKPLTRLVAHSHEKRW